MKSRKCESVLSATRAPRKLLLVFSSVQFFTKYGHFGELLLSLRKSFKVHVASIEKYDYQSDLGDVDLVNVGLGRLTAYRLICYLLFPLIAIRTSLLCFRKQIDVIVGFNGGHPQLVAHLASILSRRPIILYVRVDHRAIRNIQLGNSASVAIWDFLITWSLRRATCVVALSQFLSEKTLSWGISPKKIRVIPFGVDLAVFKPMAVEHEYANSVVFIGRWSQEKGIDLLLRIAERLKNVDFILVGAGPDKIPRSASNLHPVGFVPHKELRKYIAMGKVVLSTSLTEGQPMSCLEALACGKPVVANRKGGLRELINSDVGWLFDGDDVEVAASTLTEALKDEHVLDQKGKKAREYAKNFSWDTHAQNISKAIETISKHAEQDDSCSRTRPGRSEK